MLSARVWTGDAAARAAMPAPRRTEDRILKGRVLVAVKSPVVVIFRKLKET